MTPEMEEVVAAATECVATWEAYENDERGEALVRHVGRISRLRKALAVWKKARASDENVPVLVAPSEQRLAGHPARSHRA